MKGIRLALRIHHAEPHERAKGGLGVARASVDLDSLCSS